MKAKLYFGTLFLIFIYFGAFQEQVSITNQEIVLEFVDAKINKEEISNTITGIKEKLLKVGVSNIKIQETEKGTLRISYYSFVDTNNIKEVLLLNNQLPLNKENKKTVSLYSINVYEITNQTDISSLNDEYILEIKVNSDRFTTNYNSASLRNLETYKADQLFKTTYKICKNDPFTKDYTSYLKPEVRAGPQQNNI